MSSSAFHHVSEAAGAAGEKSNHLSHFYFIFSNSSPIKSRLLFFLIFFSSNEIRTRRETTTTAAAAIRSVLQKAAPIVTQPKLLCGAAALTDLRSLIHFVLIYDGRSVFYSLSISKFSIDFWWWNSNLQSLYNACGIKYNKKRRERLGLETGKKKKSGGGANRSSEVREILKMRFMTFGVQRSRKLMGKLREEEQAAILLMALSCGSAVYS